MSRPRITRLLLALVALFGVATQAAQAGPTLLKRTVVFNTRHYTSYWKDDVKEVDYHWSWLPIVEFWVLGPVEPGTLISVEYTRPDGKPWYTDDLTTRAIAADEWVELKSEISTTDQFKKKALTTPGVFGYKIVLKNELLGTSETLMSGRFSVEKYKPNFADKPNEFGFYVDQDWRLPIGWVWTDPDQYTALRQTIWLRGDGWDFSNLHGYMFYNGKEIGSTKKQYSSGSPGDEITTSSGGGSPKWQAYEFTWHGILGTNAHGGERDDLFFLDRNPGNYELKVLHSGKLVRTLAFTVAEDGKIVDNGIVGGNQIGGVRSIVPVKIIGDVDGTWNRDAWKKDAMYGNPLVGFSAQ